MEKLNTPHFLETGNFPEIPFGSERDFIFDILGQPDCTIENLETSVYRFHNFELHFYHYLNNNSGLLFGITILPLHEDDEETDSFLTDFGWLKKGTTYHQVKAKLNSLKIKYTETTSEVNEDDKVIITSGGVVFFFFEDDQKICKVGKFADADNL